MQFNLAYSTGQSYDSKPSYADEEYGDGEGYGSYEGSNQRYKREVESVREEQQTLIDEIDRLIEETQCPDPGNCL